MTNNTRLTFSPEEVASNYPAFFKRYPVDPEVTAIGSIFKQNFDVAKKKLRDFFPFGKDGRLLMATYADRAFIISNAFPNTFVLLRVARHYGDHSQDSEILENKKLDGAKFSRYILALYKKNEAFKRDIDNRMTWYDACQELPLLPLVKKHDFETIVQNFYSELAKVRDTKVNMIFSVNPYDIANASNGGRFSSCNALGGQHENAPICAAASPTMAIIKLENADTKELLGRCYVSVSEDFKSFVVQPTYGYMKDDFVKDAEKWMCSYINAMLPDAEQPWYRHDSLDTVHPAYVSDCKLANFYVDNSASVYNRKDYGSLPAIKLGDCRCLVCGELSLQVVCNNCKNEHFSKCRCCSLPTPKGENLCSYHKENLRYCEDCGDEFVGDPTETLCEKCRYFHSRCVICGHSITVYRNSNHNHGITELLGGLLHAHTSCIPAKEDKPEEVHTDSCGLKYTITSSKMRTNTCRDCGKPCGPYNYRCFFCSAVQEGKEYANRVVREIKRFRERLAWATTPADISVGSHMLLPTGYAIAA